MVRSHRPNLGHHQSGVLNDDLPVRCPAMCHVPDLAETILMPGRASLGNWRQCPLPRSRRLHVAWPCRLWPSHYVAPSVISGLRGNGPKVSTELNIGVNASGKLRAGVRGRFRATAPINHVWPYNLPRVTGVVEAVEARAYRASGTSHARC